MSYTNIAIFHGKVLETPALKKRAGEIVAPFSLLAGGKKDNVLVKVEAKESIANQVVKEISEGDFVLIRGEFSPVSVVRPNGQLSVMTKFDAYSVTLTSKKATQFDNPGIGIDGMPNMAVFS